MKKTHAVILAALLVLGLNGVAGASSVTAATDYFMEEGYQAPKPGTAPLANQFIFDLLNANAPAPTGFKMTSDCVDDTLNPADFKWTDTFLTLRINIATGTTPIFSINLGSTTIKSPSLAAKMETKGKFDCYSYEFTNTADISAFINNNFCATVNWSDEMKVNPSLIGVEFLGTANPVPLPATAWLLGSGLLGLLGLRRRQA